MVYLILIGIILFSYTILESIVKKIFPSLGKDQLWANVGYYSWGLVLLIIYLIIRPMDYITKIPINNILGISFIISFSVVTIFICIKDPNVYYPRKNNKLKCFHYGVIQPILEEVAFRGLILPMTIYLSGNNTSLIILLNSFIFMFFHLNYWSLEKKHKKLFINFFMLGLFFNYIAIGTQSIFYGVLCHIIVNGGNTLYRNWVNRK
ncbi:CPBP family intramembrane metalloprotease [Clostridium sp. MSJ-4]|uniref:CPBP family intramembrane metalloprotease n=1 Tax=Clostridium simiarum TaxID=2841506 RepID=A0ABS6EYM2_9CLOT|nr:CPBP family intramembrane glutamic endopeptidase [Clostridium simiarum]MBU5591315.1 CPBP family intramembrane metalloprotease [Clostridium simiarum]